MDQLERKLTTDERVIVGLFTVHPLSSSLIKEKLSSLQTDISEIPLQFGEHFYVEWREKIAALWRQYATEQNEQAKGPVPRTKSIFDRDHIFKTPCYMVGNHVPQFESHYQSVALPKAAKSTFTDASFMSSLSNGYTIPIPSAHHAHSVPFVNANVQSVNNPISKEIIHRNISLQFDRLCPVASSAQSVGHYSSREHKRIALRHEVKLVFDQLIGQLDASNVDLAELRKLHSAVANARHLLLHNSLVMDTQLHVEMFDLAYPRLPTEWREQYFQMFANAQRKSLRDLLTFLTDKLADQFSQKFSLLPPVLHVGDIEPMKALLTTISQTFLMFCPGFKRFNEQIFDLAYSKLSANLCALYREVYESNHHGPFGSLLNLKKFIATLLANDMNAVDRSVICFECSQPGHMAKHCPNLMCTRCLRVGHVRKDCIEAITF